METLTTLATFDDLRRCEGVLTDGLSEIGKFKFYDLNSFYNFVFFFTFIEFLRFVQAQERSRLKWLNAVHEADRLQRELDGSLQNVAGLETKLYHARRLLEAETKLRKEVERERDSIVSENAIVHIKIIRTKMFAMYVYRIRKCGKSKIYYEPKLISTSKPEINLLF